MGYTNYKDINWAPQLGPLRSDTQSFMNSEVTRLIAANASDTQTSFHSFKWPQSVKLLMTHAVTHVIVSEQT